MSIERDELAELMQASITASVPVNLWRGDLRKHVEVAVDTLIAAGYRKIFDGDCGLSTIKDPSEREAAEAWMRFSNIVLGNDHDGIGAMKQMLTELGYRKNTHH